MDKKIYRFCALWHDGCGKARTKVLFRPRGSTNDNEIVAYWMDRDVYQKIPLLTDATPEDYQQYGEINPALDTNIYSNV